MQIECHKNNNNKCFSPYHNCAKSFYRKSDNDPPLKLMCRHGFFFGCVHVSCYNRKSRCLFNKVITNVSICHYHFSLKRISLYHNCYYYYLFSSFILGHSTYNKNERIVCLFKHLKDFFMQYYEFTHLFSLSLSDVNCCCFIKVFKTALS